MIDIALEAAFWMVALAILVCFYRLLRGPTIIDRLLAADTLSVNAVALLMLVELRLDSPIFFEAALLIAMMGFVSTVSYCKHILGRSVIE